jgi:CMP-N-acetylneuraminic acid synthetase
MPASDIYVSSENPEVEDICRRYDLQFLTRTEHLTRNETPFADVITALIGELPDDDDVMWVTVTEPFFDEFADCLQTWSDVRDEHDSLVVVKPLTEFILDANGQPVNYQFGPWHLASQFLPKWFSVPHALHIVKRDTVDRCKYIIGTKPKLYVSTSRSIDIDDQFDFDIARELYELVSRKTN